MNKEAFVKGFIKRGQEYGIQDTKLLLKVALEPALESLLNTTEDLASAPNPMAAANTGSWELPSHLKGSILDINSRPMDPNGWKLPEHLKDTVFDAGRDVKIPPRTNVQLPRAPSNVMPAVEESMGKAMSVARPAMAAMGRAAPAMEGAVPALRAAGKMMGKASPVLGAMQTGVQAGQVMQNPTASATQAFKDLAPINTLNGGENTAQFLGKTVSDNAATALKNGVQGMGNMPSAVNALVQSLRR